MLREGAVKDKMLWYFRNKLKKFIHFIEICSMSESNKETTSIF